MKTSKLVLITNKVLHIG